MWAFGVGPVGGYRGVISGQRLGACSRVHSSVVRAALQISRSLVHIRVCPLLVQPLAWFVKFLCRSMWAFGVGPVGGYRGVMSGQRLGGCCRVHSSVVRAADCRSAGPWFKSGCALFGCSRWLGLCPGLCGLCKYPATRNRTRDHLIAAGVYSHMLYQLSYSRRCCWLALVASLVAGLLLLFACKLRCMSKWTHWGLSPGPPAC